MSDSRRHQSLKVPRRQSQRPDRQCESSDSSNVHALTFFQNDYFTSQAGMNLKAFSDIPADARAESARRAASNLKENLGDKADSDPRNAANMALLGSLGSHDLSAMRDVLGMPEKCLAATRSSDDGEKSSWWWTALFQYKGFVAHYEVSGRTRL